MTDIISELDNEVEEKPVTWLDYLKDQSVPFDERLDRWEEFISQYDPAECPLVHEFPQDMYVRRIVMPTGAIVVSQIHKKDNPFFVTRGRVTVISDNEGVREYVAPFHGITKPGTRRLLFIHEETEWTTVHPNPKNLTDVQQLEDELCEMKPRTKQLREEQKLRLIESKKGDVPCLS